MRLFAALMIEAGLMGSELRGNRNLSCGRGFRNLPDAWRPPCCPASVPGLLGVSQRRRPLLTAVLPMAAIAPLAAAEAPRSAAGDWAFYGGDAGGSRYSQLDQINKANVAELKPAWEFRTGDVSDGSDGRPKSEFEATPIVVAGTMFLTTPFNRVLAIDPETGQRKWSFDPKIDPHVHYS